jgi:hypothetical protein
MPRIPRGEKHPTDLTAMPSGEADRDRRGDRGATRFNESVAVKLGARAGRRVRHE